MPSSEMSSPEPDVISKQWIKRLKAETRVEKRFIHEEEEPHLPEIMDTKLPRGFVEVEGKTYAIDDYLGKEWEEKHTLPLRDEPPAQVPEAFVVTPSLEQLKSAGKMDFLCKSTFRGGICCNIKDHENTLLATIIMEMAREEQGAFSLVVCSASSRGKWEKQILSAYRKSRAPKLLILDSPYTSAPQLQAEAWDIIIVSYEFLNSNHRAVLEFREKWEKCMRGEGLSPRPLGGICSPFWKYSELPIRRVILDDWNRMRREDSVLCQSLRVLFHNGIVMLPGPSSSKVWHEIANPITLLGGQPFKTKAQFMNAFVTDDSPPSAIRISDKSNRSLQKLVAAFSLAGSSSDDKDREAPLDPRPDEQIKRQKRS